MRIDRTSTEGLPALRPESQSWVDTSIAQRPLLDWRELVIKGMHCNRSSCAVAFPILQKYRLPATICVTIESVETGQVAWNDRVFLAMAVAPSGALQLDLGSPFELRRLQVGPDGSLARFAFDLGRAFQCADEVPALNVSLAGSAGAQQARGPVGIGGALGDSDA